MAQNGILFGGLSYWGEDIFGKTPVSDNTVVELGIGTFNVTAYSLADALLNIPLGAGSFAVTGNDITVALNIPFGVGTFTVTGNGVDLTSNIPLGAGSFLVTGYDINAIQVSSLNTGVFTVTGSSIDLLSRIPLGIGEYLVTGQDIGVVVGAAPNTAVTSRGVRIDSQRDRELEKWRREQTILDQQIALVAVMAYIEEEERHFLAA